MGDIDRRIHALAASQHGVFSRAQARQIGITRQMITTRVRRGDLDVRAVEVLALAGAPCTEHQLGMVAVLTARAPAAVSHGSAAAWWGLPGFRSRPIELVAVRASRRIDDPCGVLHTTTSLPDTHVTHLEGVPVTVPARTLFDIAGRVHPERLGRLVDAAWRSRLVTGRLLRRTLAELAEHGRPGIQVMRELIDERGDGYRPNDSGVEARFDQLAHEVGVHTLRRQVDVGGADWLGRVDFLDAELPLIVEVDSQTFHTSLTDQRDDEARRGALVRAGYTILVVHEHDVWHRPRTVQDRLLAVRRSLRGAPAP